MDIKEIKEKKILIDEAILALLLDFEKKRILK